MALHLDVEPGDTIRIGNTLVRMERKNGRRARLSIDSSEDIAQYKAGDPVPDVFRRLQIRRQEQGAGVAKTPKPTLVLKQPQ